jgi:VCBS repeat-containing protein
VGYRYYAGMHMALCHGPADKLIRIRVGDKDAWVGAATGGGLDIDAPDLFGGDRREGGISGTVDIEMGAPGQLQNSYLASKLGTELLPAFRGVVCAVLRQVYMGLNPYLKDWAWLMQRVYTSSEGVGQWYSGVAGVGSYAVTKGEDTSFEQTVFVLEPNAWGWYFEFDPNSSKTSADIPGYGTDAAPFVDRYPPDPTQPWNPAYMPGGKIFESGNGTRHTFIVEQPAPGQYWTSKEFTLADMSPVYFDFRSNADTAFFINDVPWGEVTGGGNSFVPQTDTIKFTFRHESYVIGSTNFYNNAAAWQVLTSSTSSSTGSFCDMNPAHIVREALTDSEWGMGYSVDDVDDDSFVSAADTLFDEGMGISILWHQQSSIEDFVSDILRHIDASLSVDRSSGKFKLKLIRADYDVEDLLVLDQSNIVRVEQCARQTMAELSNEITVTYNSNETGQNETVTLQDLAAIQQQGVIIGATVEYPGFANATIAAKVAERDLRSLSFPRVSCVIYAQRVAAALEIGDCFVWNWNEVTDAGEIVASSYVMRATEIAFGDGVENTVRITCTQDVFDLPQITYMSDPGMLWEDPVSSPTAATTRLVTEAPYYELARQRGDMAATSILTENPDAGFVMVAAAAPSAATINAVIQIDAGVGYADGGALDFCPGGVLAASLSRLGTTLTLSSSMDLDDVAIGQLAQIDSELVEISNVSGMTVNIRRGMLDTVPVQHEAGAVLVIWDVFGASDEVEYVSSDVIAVKIIPVTGRGELPLAQAPVDFVTMASRAIRPHRPAGLAVNADLDPVWNEQVAIPATITWAHRNRIQETGGTRLGWDDGSITLEAGVEYRFLVEELNPSGAVIGIAIDEQLTGTSRVIEDPDFGADAYLLRVTVTAQRDGYDCWQSPSIMFGARILEAFDDQGATTADTTTGGNVLGNDRRVTATVVSEVNGVVGNIGVAVNGSDGGVFVIGADGTWTFDPDGNFDALTGTDTMDTAVIYTSDDGETTDTATLTVTVSAAV